MYASLNNLLGIDDGGSPRILGEPPWKNTMGGGGVNFEQKIFYPGGRHFGTSPNTNGWPITLIRPALLRVKSPPSKDGRKGRVGGPKGAPMGDRVGGEGLYCIGA